jgi:large subunit ribosomal protein L6
MSRVGKKPIVIPEKTDVVYKDRQLNIKGPKGNLETTIHPDIDLKIDDKEISVLISREDRNSDAFHGMTRALVANMVHGVSEGFVRVLEVNGIGYRVEVKGSTVVLSVGYSKPVEFQLPKGISAEVEKNQIKISGIDKQQLGQVASEIRRIRPPEPYKGKGIKYLEETIQRKAGKTAA